MTNRKPVDRRIGVPEVVAAIAGAGELTTRQVFSALAIPSGQRTNGGTHFGPTDDDLTTQATLALAQASASGKIRRSKGKSPITYSV